MIKQKSWKKYLYNTLRFLSTIKQNLVLSHKSHKNDLPNCGHSCLDGLQSEHDRKWEIRKKQELDQELRKIRIMSIMKCTKIMRITRSDKNSKKSWDFADNNTAKHSDQNGGDLRKLAVLQSSLIITKNLVWICKCMK